MHVLRSRKLLVGPVLLLALLTAACTDRQMRQASVAIRDFAVGLEKTQEAVGIAHDSRFISDSDYRAIQKAIGEVAGYGQEAVTAIRVAKSKPDAIAAIDKALEATDRLLKAGQLGIKNDNTKVAITAIILSVRTTLVTAKALLS